MQGLLGTVCCLLSNLCSLLPSPGKDLPGSGISGDLRRWGPCMTGTSSALSIAWVPPGMGWFVVIAHVVACECAHLVVRSFIHSPFIQWVLLNARCSQVLGSFWVGSLWPALPSSFPGVCSFCMLCTFYFLLLSALAAAGEHWLTHCPGASGPGFYFPNNFFSSFHEACVRELEPWTQNDRASKPGSVSDQLCGSERLCRPLCKEGALTLV